MKRVCRPGLKVVGGVLLFVLLTLGLLQANEAWEEQAQARMRAERSAFAPTHTVRMGRMPAELRESSGLGISRTHPGVFWTHNDSGDRPRLYAIDSTATLLATVEVEGAAARDWEAMALGPCPEPNERSCVYLADVGDNSFRRETVTIYIIEEPDPSAGDGAVLLLGAVSFVYPDRPHNAEGLAVTADADLIVVTKERRLTTWLFEIPAADVAAAVVGGGLVTLAEGRRLPIRPDPAPRRLVTGAALNAGGDVLAVRTYSEIYFFRWPVSDPPEQVAEACFLGDAEPQGEAIAFRDDGWLVLTSESWWRRPGYLQAVRCGGIGSQARLASSLG